MRKELWTLFQRGVNVKIIPIQDKRLWLEKQEI